MRWRPKTLGRGISEIRLLEGQARPTRELDRLSAIAADICLRHDVLLSLYPVSLEWLAEPKSPLFENIRREGVRL